MKEKKKRHFYMKQNIDHIINRYVLIALMLICVSLSHYLTNFNLEQIHDVYTRLYYLPIILGAFWFGFRGGTVVSLFAVVAFLPHVFFQWRIHAHHSHFNQYIEMAMFVVIGMITGLLADMEKRQRERARSAYKKLEESYEKASEAERLAAIGSLSAGVAHEVRNPLSDIKGALEIISSDISNENPKYRFVTIADKEISRIETIISEFLLFSRPPRPEYAPVNINAICKSVVELSRKQINESAISVDLVLNDDLPLSFMDQNQMRQVILNLVLNAIQAMDSGGTIQIKTEINDKYIFVDISDNGKGIPDCNENDIFTPFYTTKSNGTGLGLAISRRIVREHNGDITVKKNYPTGSIFTVHIPILEEAPEDEKNNSYS